jgi:anaerobic dimethyl sulfoxide reductase subunit B (iron-sulfur subunit)
VEACPAEAITKREVDGIVTLDAKACLGKDSCGRCLEACPYGAPQFTAEENAKMQKCDMCIDRLELGKKPICVTGCPMRALDAGPIDELRAKYKAVETAESFTYMEALGPSVVFNPKRNTKGLPVRRIDIKPDPVDR